MSGWVLSYVKGVNPDGTYRLNTKKAADPKLIRALLVDSVPNRRPPLVRLDQQPFLITLPSHSFQLESTLDLHMYKKDILDILGLSGSHGFNKMTGFSGGQNEGIWFIPNLYCLKVVRSGRRFSSIPSERENYINLLNRFPRIIEDHNACFPKRILTISNVYDIFVMPIARGDRMAELISRIQSSDTLLRLLFIAVGKQVRRFHATYGGTQHGDLQTSNIFVDFPSVPSDPMVTLIDLGGMGTKGQMKSDIEYFLESIKLLAKTYGVEFETLSTRAFIEGYR